MKATFTICCAFVVATSSALSVNSQAAESSGDELYRRIVADYLDGKWDEVESGLLSSPDKLQALAPQQQNDLAEIRKARDECRPLWWQICKKGERAAFRPTIWGKTLDVTYVPDGQRGVQAQYHNNDASFTVTWPAAEMDNPAPFEHGFTKADANAVEVWAMLGTARVWSQVSGRALAAQNPKERLRETRREDFRSNLTALYYGSPKSRRWALLVDLLSWRDKEYASLPVAGSRKAVAAMVLSEVAAAGADYPSFPPPKTLDADSAEEQLAWHYRNWIGTHAWTFAEDRQLRAAIKKFAAANDANVFQTEKVTLPNKLTVSVEPSADPPLRAKRDAWLKARFDEARPKP